jgi:HD-like signal output (HDOD) protein
MTATTLLTPGATSIDLIVPRVGTLYSLPAVAAEVLQLTNHPKVDVRALKECIQRDPALTAKILRVVNSSLFGLSRAVGDLNEALALLGTKQLKLLVLGFSLPENLFLEVAAPQLAWYWNATLARAVAAREISEQLFRQPGDDAFLAGLLQDLGVLVLLRELGAPYVALISDAISYGADVKPLERQALGFDHTQLTAGLLAHWHMPPLLVAAIGERHDHKRLSKNRGDHTHLARVLHLAELLAQLVGQHRLSVLPDLLDAGREYCELDKTRLHDLVAGLEPKVRQLADVLSVDAARAASYLQTLADAHEQLSQVAESVVKDLQGGGEGDAEWSADGDAVQSRRAQESAAELRAAIQRFMTRPASSRETLGAATPTQRAGESPVEPAAKTAPRSVEPTPRLPFPVGDYDEFTVRLTLTIGQCRSLHQPLSMVQVGVGAVEAQDPDQAKTIERFLDAACRGVEGASQTAPVGGGGRRVLVLPGRDRQEAVVAARAVIDRLKQLVDPLTRSGQLPTCLIAAGVASVASPAKNFQAQRLLETAERCLAAALAGGGVKSLEVI